MIFAEFFEELRKHGVPVSLNEWMVLQDALERKVIEPDLASFYRVSRAVLVKDESYYDRFDRAFAITFRDAEPPEQLLERLIEAMKKEFSREFSEDEIKLLQSLPLDQVLQNFIQQLEDGRYKGHEGGNKAIGRRGTSTQGADGFNPAGIRLGQTKGKNKKAIQIAEFRRFREYERNRTLDTRGMRVALSRLRKMTPDGPADELNLDKTIDRTAREAGEIELVFDPRKRNTRKVLLLTDVGGSMSGFADLVSRLFSAMKGEIRELVHYYFHNCPYEHLYEDAARRQTIPTHEVIEKYRSTHLLVMVGDAAMAPTELLHPGGAIDLYLNNPRPGADYLQDFRYEFKKSIWLNPEPERNWDHIYTLRLIREIFPMFPLTQDGIVAGVEHLTGKKRAA